MQASENGIVNLPCSSSVSETSDRLQAMLKAKGIMIFACIDLAAEAAAVGLSLRPTTLIIFGDPRSGTPLMNAYPSLALDLPLKAMIWQDQDSKVWLSYNSPAYLQKRHGLPMEPFQPIVGLLAQVVAENSPP